MKPTTGKTQYGHDNSKSCPQRRHRKFGPTALLTGASDGIGRAFSEQLEGEGLDPMLISRREAEIGSLGRTLWDMC